MPSFALEVQRGSIPGAPNAIEFSDGFIFQSDLNVFSEGTIPTRTIAGGGARTYTILRSLDFESSASASSATPAKRIVKLRRQRQSSSASNEIQRLQTSRRSVSKPADSPMKKIRSIHT